MDNPADELVSSGEAQDVLGVDRTSVVRMVKTGKLIPARQLPGQRGAYLFHRSDVERLAAERRADLEAQLARIGTPDTAAAS